MPRINKRSPCTDEAFIQAVSELDHPQVRNYLDRGYDVNLFPQDKFWDLCLFKPNGNDENATKRMIKNKRNIVLAILGYEYKPDINPDKARRLSRSGPDFQDILFFIGVALQEPPIQEPPLREESLREASLQEPPLREASLVSFLDENYESY
jgi:hypothetical protein